MKKSLHISLFISFAIAIMIPLTGIYVHKAAALIFLVLALSHIVVYRKKLNNKRGLLFAAIVLSFITGLLGTIWNQFPAIMTLHQAGSIAIVFFLAIHCFVYRKKMYSRAIVR